jgi:prolyl oligopeptidase
MGCGHHQPEHVLLRVPPKHLHHGAGAKVQWIMALAMVLLSASISAQPTADPFRWLEADTGQGQDWRQAQHARTVEMLSGLSTREKWRQLMAQSWDYARIQAVAVAGQRYFYYFNPGMQDHYELYWSELPASGDASRNSFDVAAAGQALPPVTGVTSERWRSVSVNANGSAVLLQLVDAWHVGFVDSGDSLALTANGHNPVLAAWANSQDGVWSSDAQSLYYHQLQSDSSSSAAESSVTVYQPEDGWVIEALLPVPQLERIIVAESQPGRHRLTLLADRSGSRLGRWNTDMPVRRDGFWQGEDAGLWFAGAIGDEFIFYRREGSRSAGDPVIYTASLADTALRSLSWDAPLEDAHLSSVQVVGDVLLVEYLRHGQSLLYQQRLNGAIVGQVALPEPVRLDRMRAAEPRQLLLAYSGLTIPPQATLLDLGTGNSMLLSQDMPPAANLDVRLELSSTGNSMGENGTVPYYVVSPEKKTDADSLIPDINNHVLVETYGGFGAPIELGFSIARYVWLLAGGHYVVVGPAGDLPRAVGGFIHVASGLQTQGSKVSAMGRSHGALLVTMAVLKAPDVFSSVVADAGLHDLPSFLRLGGAASWMTEYGDPGVAQSRDWMVANSSYHQALTGEHSPASLPPVLAIARPGDDIVAPAHSYKLIAALQRRHGDEAAAWLYDAEGEGHSPAGTVNALILEYADRWSFLASAPDVRQ